MFRNLLIKLGIRPKTHPCAGTNKKIRYKDGHIMEITYPKTCPYTHESLGDYCWGLAVAFENGTEKEFTEKNCPCEI